MKAASAAFFTGEKEVVMDKKRIWVAVGVVENSDDQVFICRRTDGQHQAGKWEFPGGKVECGEGMPAALIRELAEEIGIEVQQCEPLLQIEHDYPDKSVLLDVWRVTAFEGEPYGREGQAALWVERDALLNYEFPEANQPITRKVMGW
jgi:8-oxo-dGTP diphosphatase